MKRHVPIAVACTLVWRAAVPAWANVYASGLSKTGSNSLSYILSDNAGGVTIQVWEVGAPIVRGPKDPGPLRQLLPAASLPAAATASVAVTALGALPGLVDGNCPSANVLAVDSLDRGRHVFLGEVHETEALAMDQPHFLDGAEGLEHLAELFLRAVVRQVANVK